jgi:hypothetical protein
MESGGAFSSPLASGTDRGRARTGGQLDRPDTSDKDWQAPGEPQTSSNRTGLHPSRRALAGILRRIFSALSCVSAPCLA